MIYDRAVQRVAPPCSVLPDVALLRRKWGEESQQEKSTHAECIAARRSSQLAWHEECRQSSVSIRHVIIGSALLVLRAAMPGMSAC